MISLKPASDASNGPYGCARWKRTRFLLTTSVLFQAEKNTPSGCVRNRSKVNLTSAAVIGWPLWNTALSTRSSVHVFASSCFHCVARLGTNLKLGVTLISFEKMLS